MKICPGCGAELPPEVLSCPSCGQLTHAEELKRLAEQAAQAATPAEALASWRSALALLPPGTRQYDAVMTKLEALVRTVDAGSPTTPAGGTSGKRAGGIAGIFAAVVALLAKGKFLLLGLAKLSTLGSMLLSMGVFWQYWGWQLAVGIVLSIYVHEMGHVAMLRRYGIRATAPMFIPGFGALILLREKLPTAREDARVGLAGPVWGTGAAVAAWAIWMVTGSGLFAVIARWGAIINLFNLTPVWFLDGSHAFRALTREQRWIIVAVVGAAYLVCRQEMLLLVLAFAIWRCFEKDIVTEPDRGTLVEFIWLVVMLSALSSIPTHARV